MLITLTSSAAVRSSKSQPPTQRVSSGTCITSSVHLQGIWPTTPSIHTAMKPKSLNKFRELILGPCGKPSNPLIPTMIPISSQSLTLRRTRAPFARERLPRGVYPRCWMDMGFRCEMLLPLVWGQLSYGASRWMALRIADALFGCSPSVAAMRSTHFSD